MTPSQEVIVQKRIYLDAYDINLTETARRKHSIRKLFKLLAFLAAPLIIAQAIAFGSFIYEEALQASSFGVRAAIQCEDAALAYDAVKRFQALVHQAQWFQDHIGCLAFWSHGAFSAYFHQAAPVQLTGMYLDGKKLGLWGENTSRYVQVRDPVTHETLTIDDWRIQGINRFTTQGFDPEIASSPHNCLRCRENQKLTGILPTECGHVRFARYDDGP
jgi:hypothetical protein